MKTILSQTRCPLLNAIVGLTLLLAPLAQAGYFVVSPWTDDASSGITSTTMWAYNFGGSPATTTIAGTEVKAAPGANPVIPGDLLITGTGAIATDPGNAITNPASSAIANGFIYDGSPSFVFLGGLEEGKTYVATFLSVAWEAVGLRKVEFSSGGDSRVIDQHYYGNDNGIRVDYVFTATAGTQIVTLTPTAGATWHHCGLALREARQVVVTRKADSGAGSLRHAIDNAMIGDVITFKPSVFNTNPKLTLTNGQLLIDQPLTIDASGLSGSLTIEAAANHRVLEIASDQHVSLHRLTLTGGDSADHGGGILNHGYLMITDSTISGNRTDRAGGGLRSDPGSEVSISRCTFSGNVAIGDGGGAAINNATAVFTNCTVSGNQSDDGAGIWGANQAAMEIIHGTIANNTASNRGGGIRLATCDLTLENTIVANNTAQTVNEISKTAANNDIVRRGVNFIGDNSSVAAEFPAGSPNDLVGTSAAPLDALLAPLGDYGGPTQTMTPFTGSPVVGAAEDSAIATDQRGIERSQDPGIGAAELVSPIVSSSVDFGSGSLREAIKYGPPGESITFDGLLDGDTIVLLGTELFIDRDLTIDASSIPGGITIDANKGSRVMKINPGHTVTLSHLTLASGDSPGNRGGAIYNDRSNLTLNHTTLSGNTAEFGGGIYSNGNQGTATLTLNHSTLSGNSSTSYGGGIYSNGYQGTATLTLNHSTLSGNSATSYGGGIYSSGSGSGTATLTLINSIVAANSAPTGPDIRNISGTVTPTGVNLLSDLANSTLTAGPNVLVADPLLAPLGDYGGPTQTMPPHPGSPAIDRASASTALTDQRGVARSVDGDRDTVSAPDIGAVELHPLYVTNNNDSGAGSLRDAVANAADLGTAITFHPSVFTGGANNTVTLGGTQLLIDKSLTIDASNIPGGITIDANEQSRVMAITPGHTVALSHLTLSNGRASGAFPDNIGGAIYNDHATLTLNQSTLSGNTAVRGGGIYSSGYQGTATLTLNHTTLSGNSVSSLGGGIYSTGHEGTATLTLNHSTLSGNFAGSLGGGIYSHGNQGTATLTLNHSTLSGNSASSLGGGICSRGNQGTATLKLINSIVAANSAPTGPDISNFLGTVTPTGVNLISDLSDTTLSAGPKVDVADPLLAPLGDYGGPTQTMPPRPGSPAIDRVSASTALTDQRGAVRSVDGDGDGSGLADIGAVELHPLFVTSNNDSGPGSLRNAIAEPFASYLAFDPSVFTGGANNTLTLGGTQLLIDKSLTIDASNIPGGITIDANEQSRVMEITPSHTVALSHLTLSNGRASGQSPDDRGGAIYNDHATLTLNHSTLSGNSAEVDGGCIYSNGSQGTVTLTLNHSTLAGNTAVRGGGIYSNGNLGTATLTLNHSTLAGNSATFGGGILSDGRGTGTATLNLANSIVAANSAPNGPDIKNVSGTVTPTGVNLLSDFGESTLTVGPNAFAADPLLAPLGDYGGPTQTMPPLPGSPVIDRASASTVITDQRGVARSVDGDRDADPAPDIGAVELHPLFVTTNNDSGSGSLRDALANAADLGTTIIFDPSVFTGGANNTLTLGGTQLLIDKSLTIDASNIPGGITIDANEQSRIMYITSGQTVALSHLTLCNGDASGASPENIGGAIYNNHATVTLNHSTLSGNSASAFGGGIFSDGRFFGTATLTLNHSTLSGNIAPSGGGIYSGGFQGTAALTLNHSTLSGNSAENDGGGIYSGGFQGTATINLINSIVAANSAPDGPDISYVSGTVTPTGVNLISDLSDTTLTAGPNVLVADPLLAPLGDYGGPTKTMPPQPGSPAIDMASAATALTDQRGAVRSVDGDGDGSGFADIGAVEFHPLFVTSNNDSGSGSLRNAIAEPFASYLAFDPSVFTGGASNTLALGGTQLLIDKSLTIDASDIPGGITIDANKHSRIMEITPGHTVTLSRLTLSNGLASGASPGNIGGAIYNHHATLTLNYSTLSGNSAVFGGGIYSNGLQGTATLTLNHSTLSGNSAGLGGGIYCNGNQGTATLRLNHSTLSGNSATSYGGSIYSIGNQGTATLTLINSIVAANSAPAGPDIRVLYGTVEPTGVNLLSDLADSTLTAGQNVLVADPLLAPLGDYGGPTQVMPPLPGSPAIEGALVLPSTPATDQLGNPRLSGPHPDIGAVEALPLEKLGLASNDGDTIPDLLEGPDGPYPHLEPGTDDSAVDTDGDGSSDADEIADMTNLYDNTDYFRVITFVQVANFDPDSPVMSITIATFPGLSYQFEKASTLENFIPVGDPFVADDFQMTFEVAMESDRDFLRVRRN